MGNQACCAPKSGDHTTQLVINQYQTIDKRPQVSDKVNNYLTTKNPFDKELKKNYDNVLRKYGADVYEGPLNILGNPDGYGKLYKSDGSLYIGEFTNGAAHGQGAFVMSDGSYYQGKIKDNNADSNHGVFHGLDGFIYKGQFKENQFHGKGIQTTPAYNFEGTFEKGKKVNGKLKWGSGVELYQYTGHFDQHNKFVGKGVLSEPRGTYEGDFLNGQKHGQGVYTYKSGLKYVGTYQKNQKKGKGVLWNANNTKSYEGQFLNGLPHGKGVSVSGQSGVLHQSEWFQGLEKVSHIQLEKSKLK